MDKKVLTALKGSIQKWHDIAYHDLEDLSADNCPLCLYFTDPTHQWVSCSKGCPVYLETKQEGCEDTPYMSWSKLQEYSSGWKANTPKKVKAAEKEINFLVCLLPEGEEAKMKDGTIYYWRWE